MPPGTSIRTNHELDVLKELLTQTKTQNALLTQMIALLTLIEVNTQ